MTVGDVDRGGDLRLVGRELAIEPGAERDLELMAGGDVGDLPEALERRVRAHRRHFAGEQSQIGVDLLRRGQHLRHRILAGAERRERHALHVVGPRRLGAGPVQPGPQRERQRRENGCDDNAGRSHRVNVAASGEEYTRCESNRIFSGSAAAAALLCLASSPARAEEPKAVQQLRVHAVRRLHGRRRVRGSDRQQRSRPRRRQRLRSHRRCRGGMVAALRDAVCAPEHEGRRRRAVRHGRGVSAVRRHRQLSGCRGDPRHSVFRHDGRRGALQPRRRGSRR